MDPGNYFWFYRLAIPFCSDLSKAPFQAPALMSPSRTMLMSPKVCRVRAKTDSEHEEPEPSLSIERVTRNRAVGRFLHVVHCGKSFHSDLQTTDRLTLLGPQLDWDHRGRSEYAVRGAVHGSCGLCDGQGEPTHLLGARRLSNDEAACLLPPLLQHHVPDPRFL
eukprot:1317964-Rhodomonas_salina.1